jgi:ADP-glucose pyrophosphorylase
MIEPGATVIDSVIGPGAIVESGAVVHDSVVWPNAKIARGTDLTRCIVCSADPIFGVHSDADL